MWSGVEGHLAPNRDVVGKLLGLEEVNFSGEMPQCGVSRGGLEEGGRSKVWRKGVLRRGRVGDTL